MNIMYSSSGCRHYIEVKYVIDATFSSTNCTFYAVDAEFCLEFVNILCNHMLTLNELGWKGMVLAQVFQKCIICFIDE